MDTTKSLKQLLGPLMKDTTDRSPLANTCRALYEKPLKDFTVEDLRVMIGQEIGLEFLVPLAIEVLEENPFAAGDYYPGDLLSMVMKVEPGFWKTHQDLYWSVSEIVGGLPELMSDLTAAIQRFDDLAPSEESKSDN